MQTVSAKDGYLYNMATKPPPQNKKILSVTTKGLKTLDSIWLGK